MSLSKGVTMISAKTLGISPRILRSRLTVALKVLDNQQVRLLLAAKRRYAAKTDNLSEADACIAVSQAADHLRRALKQFEVARVTFETVSKKN